MPNNLGQKTGTQGKGFGPQAQGDRQQSVEQEQVSASAFDVVSQGTEAQSRLSGLFVNNNVAMVEAEEANVAAVETELAQRLAVAYHPDLSASRIYMKTVNFLTKYGRNAVERTSSVQRLDLRPVPQLQLESLESMYDQRIRQASPQIEGSSPEKSEK